ncbi:hypothetical protein AUC61_13995 [Pseudomonas sp. S25]|uniref:Acyltransferase 3 domain-containing protein n=2 Tax=Pseudomonas maioricensis TaxID=1766623 RepID=A0ABS9ZJ86_9PSED|nr:hypothetical protein [Pseudomonas sp. S25]
MIGSIQLLRAFAAWIVVFHHYVQIFYGFGTTSPIGSSLANYGAIGVDIFFIISGFVIYSSSTKKHPTPFEFAKQRLFRILPAYWVFTLIVALSVSAAPYILFYATYDTEFLLKSMFFVPAQNPAGIGLLPLVTVGWTLNYEIAFYAIFFMALYAPKNLLIPIVFTGVFALQYLVPKLGGAFTFYGLPLVYEFLLGMIVGAINNAGAIKKISSPFALLMIIGSTGIIWRSGSAAHNLLHTGLPCALIVTAFISLNKYLGNFFVLNRLGDWSYSTYLCHPVITYAVLYQYKQGVISEEASLLLVCAGTAAVSWVSYNFIERPIARLAKPRNDSAPEDKPRLPT